MKNTFLGNISPPLNSRISVRVKNAIRFMCAVNSAATAVKQLSVAFRSAATSFHDETIEAKALAVAGGSSRNGRREPFDRAEP